MIQPCQSCLSGKEGLRLALVLAALLFATLAGVFLAAAAGAAWFALGPGAALGASALLLPVVVLLGVILLLLLVLLWCCCSNKVSGKGLADLAKLLPLVKAAADGLEATAQALDNIAYLTRQAKASSESATHAFDTGVDGVDVTLPSLSWSNDWIGVVPVITGIRSSTINPFSTVKENLKKVTGFADTATGRMEDIAKKCTEAAQGLRAVKSLLQLVAP